MKDTKSLKQQLTELKGIVAKILSYEILFDFEEYTLEELGELVDNLLLDRLEDKHYSAEEIADTRIIEYRIVLEGSNNKEIKKLVRILKKGLNW